MRVAPTTHHRFNETSTISPIHRSGERATVFYPTGEEYKGDWKSDKRDGNLIV
jgi:hypothetical protein